MYVMSCYILEILMFFFLALIAKRQLNKNIKNLVNSFKLAHHLSHNINSFDIVKLCIAKKSFTYMTQNQPSSTSRNNNKTVKYKPHFHHPKILKTNQATTEKP